jgi:hypothetical protein
MGLVNRLRSTGAYGLHWTAQLFPLHAAAYVGVIRLRIARQLRVSYFVGFVAWNPIGTQYQKRRV